MSTPYYIPPEESVPLPPPDADVISTACDYCIVACGYKVYRWPVKGGKVGGPPAADQNAFGEDFPVAPPLARGSRRTSTISCCTKANRIMW